jgi:hypothetical protein
MTVQWHFLGAPDPVYILFIHRLLADAEKKNNNDSSMDVIMTIMSLLN